jgi:hypothetical protein
MIDVIGDMILKALWYTQDERAFAKGNAMLAFIYHERARTEDKLATPCGQESPSLGVLVVGIYTEATTLL